MLRPGACSSEEPLVAPLGGVRRRGRRARRRSAARPTGCPRLSATDSRLPHCYLQRGRRADAVHPGDHATQLLDRRTPMEHLTPAEFRRRFPAFAGHVHLASCSQGSAVGRAGARARRVPSTRSDTRTARRGDSSDGHRRTGARCSPS
ncbi:hypothetical protein HBB16_06225 [Pseudonocardia sp. MCCB 268]|nr:hypothetical protein [Pseudonocardia cytotoxica]